MIADGRLPDGWDDPYAIKDVQRDVCAISTRIDPSRGSTRAKKDDQFGFAAHVSAARNEAHNGGEYTRPDYNKDTDGKPCQKWNWGSDCGYATSHGLQPDRHCHLCSWGINHSKKANPHPEKICQNKRRYLEKMNGGKDAKKDI